MSASESVAPWSRRPLVILTANPGEMYHLNEDEFSAVDFELSHVLSEESITSYFDTSERAVRFDFDISTRKWIRSATVVRIEPQPFAFGSMRAAHRLDDLTVRSGISFFVAKIFRDLPTDKKKYFMDVAMQAEAKLWADRFNSRVSSKNSQLVGGKSVQPVDFISSYVAILVERPGCPVVGVEQLVEGEYVKYNNNWDWSDNRRNTPQAFSHFTWEESKHTMLVCDIQGVGNVWTDPQIHSMNGTGFRCHTTCSTVTNCDDHFEQFREYGKTGNKCFFEEPSLQLALQTLGIAPHWKPGP